MYPSILISLRVHMHIEDYIITNRWKAKIQQQQQQQQHSLVNELPKHANIYNINMQISEQLLIGSNSQAALLLTSKFIQLLDVFAINAKCLHIIRETYDVASPHLSLQIAIS